MFPLAFSFSSISATARVDIACAAVILFFAVWDAVRGFSATIARLAALVLAFKLAFLLYPHIAALLPSDTAAAPALAFCLTVVAAFIIHLALKAVLARVLRVILSAPIDNIFGAISGAVKGTLLVFVVFSAIALVTGDSYSGTAFAKSRTGTRLVPAVGRILAPSDAKLPCSSGER